MPPSDLPPGLDAQELRRLITQALREDIGTGDLTSLFTIDAETDAVLRFVARGPVVACGGFIPGLVYGALGNDVACRAVAAEGRQVAAGAVIAEARGRARTLLAGERVALNLMQRMCGVATLTHDYVQAVAGTKATILDTRKTMPGLRALDKYAVRAGGGANHRMRLDDMLMLKDNHIAACGSITAAVARARAASALPLVVECDTLAQVEEALAARPDRILLDNMSPEDLRRAVALAGGKIPLEASGGITLATVRAVADTGVGFISVGALTHSALAADIGADILPS